MSKSVSDWLKSLHQKSPNRAMERSNEDAVLKSLLSEVEIQMRRREEEQRMRDMATRRRGSLVDYTWLASSSTAPKADALSHLERIELAELCLKVKPSECNYVICQFRRMASVDCDASEVPRMMRTAICEMLLERGDEAHGDESASARVSRVVWRALNAVKTPRRVSPWANPRRNSSASTSAKSNIFTVERAYSFPLLRIDKMGNLQLSPQHRNIVSLV